MKGREKIDEESENTNIRRKGDGEKRKMEKEVKLEDRMVMII